MKSRIVFCSLVLSALTLAACGGHDDPQPFAAATDLESRLEADTGAKWNLYGASSSGSGSLLVLGPEKPVNVPGSSREEKARKFFEVYRDALPQLAGLGQPAAAEELADADGSNVVKITFVVPGTNLPVFDTATAVHFDATGAVRYVEPGPSADVVGMSTGPRLDATAALRFAHGAIVAKCRGDAAGDPPGVLGAYPIAGAKARLAYRFRFDEDAPECVGPEVYVDANTGGALAVNGRGGGISDLAQGGGHYRRGVDDVKAISVSLRPDRSYELSDYDRVPWVRTSRGDWTGKDPNHYPVTSSVLGMWGDIDRGVSVDAHFHARKALDFFQTVFGRFGIDGRGGALTVVTDDATSLNAKGPNAYYRNADGVIRFSRSYQPISFHGEAPRTHLPYSHAFDVVVHELAHGVIFHTSNLTYRGESGAINESFCDVMGASAEHWLPETRATADMIVGKEGTADGLGLRDMMNPTSNVVYDQRADYRAPGDNGDVHRNSGIGNRAFSLMTFGGKTNELSIGRGLGFEASRYLWWETVTRAANPNMSWRQLALSQMLLAKNMGFETNAAVACAWIAVGVVERHEADPDFTKCGLPLGAPVQATCAGVEDGIVCSDVAPNSAYICKRGSIAGAHYCLDLRKRCAHAIDSFRAARDSNGNLVCQ